MNILYFYAPWTKDLFECFVHELSKHTTVDNVYGLTHLNGPDSVMRDINRESKKAVIVESSSFSQNEIQDIILRCRYLRNLDKLEAAKLVVLVEFAIINFVTSKNISFVLVEAIDNYVYDILFRVAETHDIKTLSYIHSFINGFVRLSARGEHNYTSEPQDSDVEALRSQLLVPNYTPTNLVKIKEDLTRRYMTVWLSNIARMCFFYPLYLINKNNYHYVIR